MKLKSVLIILISLFFGSLTAISNLEIADSLYRHISSQISKKDIKAISFDFQNINSVLIYNHIASQALKDNYVVFLSPDSAEVLIQIDTDIKESYKKKTLFFFSKQKKVKENIYFLSITDLKNNRLLYAETLSYESDSYQKQSEVKWYDPFLLTAVVGSLIYLVYYGNQK